MWPVSPAPFLCFVQLDLREQGLLRFSAGAPYPLITFGPFPSPQNVVAALARATGEAKGGASHLLSKTSAERA